MGLIAIKWSATGRPHLFTIVTSMDEVIHLQY